MTIKFDDDVMKENYLKSITTPVPYKPPVNLGDVAKDAFSGVKEGYKFGSKLFGDSTLGKIGNAITGGIAGAGYGVAKSIPKLLEYGNTSAGQGIIAGSVGSPYLSQGYLNNAKEVRAKEESEKTQSRDYGLKQLGEQGEYVRQQAKSKSDAEALRSQYDIEWEKNAPLRALQEKTFGAKNQETNYEQTIKPLKDMADDFWKNGTIDDVQYQKMKTNPLKYKVSTSGNKVGTIGKFFGKTGKAGIVEGVLHQDKVTGAKAYMFPDGTFQEVKE